MFTGTASIVRGNARHIPLADNSVDLVVSSPPYFLLRSYQDGGEHYEGQIGDEPTPTEFIDSLLEVTKEAMRVLKDTGSLWVNLGDKYSRGSRPMAQPDQFRTGNEITFADTKYVKNFEPENSGVAGKSIIGIPWRYAIRCIDELGLILRAEVIWEKPGGMPEAVNDRVRRSHEHWFHFTLKQDYYANIDPLRGPAPDDHTLGRLPGSVWTINTQPLKVPAELGVDHDAAFPTEWPRRIIEGWAPTEVCTACEQGRKPLKGTECEGCGQFRPERKKACPSCGHVRIRKSMKQRSTEGGPKHMVGPSVCKCRTPDAPTRRAVVLDLFGGSGTTAMVAKVLGRHGISLDLSADYCRIAAWRTNDAKEMAKVLNVKAPKKAKPSHRLPADKPVTGTPHRTASATVETVQEAFVLFDVNDDNPFSMNYDLHLSEEGGAA